MLKIGKIELEDWIYPSVSDGRGNYTMYHSPYRFIPGDDFNGMYFGRTCVFINCSGPGEFWPEFHGDLKFLEKSYRPKSFHSYEDAMEYVDNFLRKMDSLIIFA
jgi:hypothetical protein